MKSIFAIIIAGLLTGCVTTDLYTPPEKTSKIETPKLSYAKAQLITDRQILNAGLDKFTGQSIKKLFPILGHPTSSLDVGKEISYQYVFKENAQSTAYTTYYNYFASTSVTTTQKEFTLSFLTDEDINITEYYASGNSAFYITSLAFKFINYFPFKCNKDDTLLTELKIKGPSRLSPKNNTGTRLYNQWNKVLYYCDKTNCNYAIKFTPYMTYLIEKNN